MSSMNSFFIGYVTNYMCECMNMNVIAYVNAEPAFNS